MYNCFHEIETQQVSAPNPKMCVAALRHKSVCPLLFFLSFMGCLHRVDIIEPSVMEMKAGWLDYNLFKGSR